MDFTIDKLDEVINTVAEETGEVRDKVKQLLYGTIILSCRTYRADPTFRYELDRKESKVLD